MEKDWLRYHQTLFWQVKSDTVPRQRPILPWASPVPERVCLKVQANPHKSQPSSSKEEDWKRGRNA